MYEKLAKLNEEIATLTKKISQNPFNWELYFKRGGSYFNRGYRLQSKEYYNWAIADYSTAIVDYSTAIEKNPDNWELYYNRGRAYNSRGNLLHSKEDNDSAIADYSTAIVDYSTAIEKNPNDWELYQRRGDSYLIRGNQLHSKEDDDSAIADYSTAIVDYSTAIDKNPDDWELYERRGNSYVNRGNLLRNKRHYDSAIADYSTAIVDYSTAIEKNPDDWELYERRGNSYFNRGNLLDSKEDYDSAIADYSTAIAVNSYAIDKNPDEWELYQRRGHSYFNRGNLLRSKEDYDSAIADYSTAIEKNPNDWELYQRRGDSYLYRGILLHSKEDDDSAIADYSTAIEKNPDDWELYERRGDSYFNRGNLLKNKADLNIAISDYTDALSINGNYFHIYYIRAYTFWLCSKYNESIEDLNAYLYYACRKPDNKEIQLQRIDQIYENELFNHWTLILSFVKFNKFSSGLMAKYFDLQEPIYDYLLILKYLGFNPNALSSTNEDFLRIIAILLYYLNGSVTTFRLFDERLDNNIGMSAMEHYYYVRSALQFAPECRAYIGLESLLYDAIKDIDSHPNKTAEDWYYLGLLYYLKGMETTTSEEERHTFEENALNCLEKAVDFVWAKALLERLKPDSNAYGEDFTKYIEQHCNAKRSIEIDPLTDFKSLIPNKPQAFLHQFEDFIHLHEVMDILPYSGPHVEYCNPLWEVFSLKDADSSLLKNEMVKTSAKDIFHNLVKEKETKGVEALTEEENQRVEDDFHQY